MYSDYTSRTKATGTLQELSSIKTEVSMCIMDTGKKEGCNHESNNGISKPNDVNKGFNVTELKEVTDGTIKAVSKATSRSGVPLTIVITPNEGKDSSKSNIYWQISGTICDDPRRGLNENAGCVDNEVTP